MERWAESCWIMLNLSLPRTPKTWKFKHRAKGPSDLTGTSVQHGFMTVLPSSGRALESSQASAVCGERRHFQPGCAETNPEKWCQNFQKHGWYTQKSNMEPKNLQILAVKWSSRHAWRFHGEFEECQPWQPDRERTCQEADFGRTGKQTSANTNRVVFMRISQFTMLIPNLCRFG